MSNTKNAAWYGNNLAAWLPFICGDIFWVDGISGNNANDGLTWDQPKLNIEDGIDLCTADANDVVIVMRYPSAGAAGETWPIAVDVSTVHLLGGGLGEASPVSWIAPAATAAFEISVNEVEIAGFDLGAGAGGDHGCIENESGTTVWRAHIHHNDFTLIRTAQDGIKIGVGSVDCPHWLVEYNQFGPTVDRDHIRIEHNSTRSVFRNNRFYVPAGAVGFHAQGLCTAIGYVIDNTFKVADAAPGEAIYFENANASMCQMHGNRVASGTVAMANNPYRDLGADNHWSINWAGLAPTYPVTT